jgi:hypothetical protein
MLGRMNALTSPRQGIPLRGDPGELARLERQSFVRAVACRVLGKLRNESPEQVARRG